MAISYRCANCGRIGPLAESKLYRGWRLCAEPCYRLMTETPHSSQAINKISCLRCRTTVVPNPYLFGVSFVLDGDDPTCSCTQSPAGGDSTPNDLRGLGLPAAPGHPLAAARGCLFGVLLSLPVWALIGWLIYG